MQTDHLSKVYGTKTVLDHVSIHVPKKSIYGLVGKNGAGKTTLMRIICGLTRQSEGSYILRGKSDDPAVRNNMGMLIEKPGIYEHMTALENLRYFSMLFGIPSQAVSYTHLDVYKRQDPTCAQVLQALLEQAGVSAPEWIAAADISKSYAYQVLRGERTPGRDILLRTALALSLSLKDAQRLLMVDVYKRQILYRTSPALYAWKAK